MNAECVRIITDDFDLNESIIPITTARGGFNYRSYLTSSIYVNMDLLLCRDFSELDPDYDYFSVKTNICTVGMSTARIEVEHQLPFAADELIDYGSGDTNRVSNSFFISDDHCTWIINRHWILGELANELFSLDSSWAAADNCTGTNVKFRVV